TSIGISAMLSPLLAAKRKSSIAEHRARSEFPVGTIAPWAEIVRTQSTTLRSRCVRSGSTALAYFKRTVTRAKFSGADALAVTRNTPTTLQRPQKALARPCGGRLRLLGWGRPLRIVGTSRTPWEAVRDAKS